MGNIFNYDIPKSEQEAHIFAIKLLIPKEELIAFINKGGQTISTCAEHFQAPKGKIREALKLYDLISKEDDCDYCLYRFRLDNFRKDACVKSTLSQQWLEAESEG